MDKTGGPARHGAGSRVHGQPAEGPGPTSIRAAGAWLVYLDAFHPGWTVAVDGKPGSVAMANLAFKGRFGWRVAPATWSSSSAITR